MGKVAKVLDEFKAGTLHSGSDEGPKVTSKKQAIAIGLSEARKAGEDVPPPKETAQRSALKRAKKKYGG